MAIHILLLALTILWSPLTTAEPEPLKKIIINPPENIHDKRNIFPNRLLNRILEVTENKYGKAEIDFSKHKMSRVRSYDELRKGKKLHLMIEISRPDLDDKVIRIDFPVRKDLESYRLFLIHKDNLPLFAEIKTIDDLKKITMGVGSQWTSRKIMGDHGFKLITSNNYEGLFEMLAKKRFQAFPRGVDEIWDELEVRQKKYPNLVIAPALALKIPLSAYFFVSPRYPQLAQRIEEGLKMLKTSGEFDRLYMEAYGLNIRRAELDKRKIFILEKGPSYEN